MKCGKCGNEIPSQSRFCLACGEPVSTGSSETPARPIPKRRLGLFAAIAGLCLVGAAVLLAFIVHGSKVTQATPVPNPQQTRVLNAPAPPNGPHPNVLQTDVQKPPLDLKKEEKPQPPPEVVAYLEHLKRVDAAREALQQREKAALYGYLWRVPADKANMAKEMMDALEKAEGPLPKDIGKLPEATKLSPRLNREWQQLAQRFLAVQAPDACAALAGKYYDALRNVIQWCSKLNDSIDNQDQNVFNWLGQSTDIDDKLDASDQELTNVCTRFGIEKAFTIKSDRGQGGGVLQFPGL